jgi:hypothetical protein
MKKNGKGESSHETASGKQRKEDTSEKKIGQVGVECFK